MADAPDLGSGAARRGGSSPLSRTNCGFFIVILMFSYLASFCAVQLHGALPSASWLLCPQPANAKNMPIPIQNVIFFISFLLVVALYQISF